MSVYNGMPLAECPSCIKWQMPLLPCRFCDGEHKTSSFMNSHTCLSSMCLSRKALQADMMVTVH